MERTRPLNTETTMKTSDRTNLLKTAAAKIEAYLLTGIEGFLQQGLDYYRACDINTEACVASGREGLEHLVRETKAGNVF
jgi:hypothetical protein